MSRLRYRTFAPLGVRGLRPPETSFSFFLAAKPPKKEKKRKSYDTEFESYDAVRLTQDDM